MILIKTRVFSHLPRKTISKTIRLYNVPDCKPKTWFLKACIPLPNENDQGKIVCPWPFRKSIRAYSKNGASQAVKMHA